MSDVNLHDTTRSVASDSCTSSSEDAPYTTLHLDQNLRSLKRCSDERHWYGRCKTDSGKFCRRKFFGCTLGRECEYQTLGCITRLKVAVTAGNLDMCTVTQKDAAKIGVTPRSGGTIPRYTLLIDN
jgi:hypothetical protein